jgi:restriction system protein
MVSGAAGCLRQLDVSYGEAPIQEVRDFLIGRYNERFKVHPRTFEEVVASVFKDLGYDTMATNYSGDDGIDVFMTKGTEIVGVQVKRYKGAIGVEQIRELAGALLLNDLTKVSS